MTKREKFKSGDIVYYKDESDRDPFVVMDASKKNKVSLSIRNYPDTEQDYYTNTSKIRKFGKKELPSVKKKMRRL